MLKTKMATQEETKQEILIEEPKMKLGFKK